MINQLKYVVGILFVAVLIYSGLWYTAAFQAEKDVAAKFANWRDQGLQVDHGKIEHGGFPYRITVSVQDFEFSTREKGLLLAASDFTLISHLWTPSHWVAEAHKVRGSIAGGATQFTDDFIHGSYRLHDNGKVLIVLNSLTLDDFNMSSLMGQTAPDLTAWQLAFWLDDPSKETKSGLYGARYLNFQITGKTKDQQLELTGGISGPILKDWSKKALSHWRDEGGLVELDTIDHIVPSGRSKGNASITLDEAFRPLGSVSLNRSGSADLRSLIEGFGLPVNSGHPNATGPASLMLQNGQIKLDGAEIAKLKPIIGR